MEAYCKERRINHVFSVPGNPEGNGLAENLVKQVKSKILKLGNKLNWPNELHKVVFGINASVHSTLGHSPHFLVFGQHPHDPLHRMLGGEPQADVGRFTARLMAANNLARHHLALDRAFTPRKALKAGDWVFVRNSDKHPNKIQDKNFGPFQIVRIFHNTAILQMPTGKSRRVMERKVAVNKLVKGPDPSWGYQVPKLAWRPPQILGSQGPVGTAFPSEPVLVGPPAPLVVPAPSPLAPPAPAARPAAVPSDEESAEFSFSEDSSADLSFSEDRAEPVSPRALGDIPEQADRQWFIDHPSPLAAQFFNALERYEQKGNALELYANIALFMKSNVLVGGSERVVGKSDFIDHLKTGGNTWTLAKEFLVEHKLLDDPQLLALDEGEYTGRFRVLGEALC